MSNAAGVRCEAHEGNNNLRVVLGTVLIRPSLIHLLGFVVYLRLAEVEALSYSTAVLSGNLEVSEVGGKCLRSSLAIGSGGVRVARQGRARPASVVVGTHLLGGTALFGGDRIGLTRLLV